MLVLKRHSPQSTEDEALTRIRIGDNICITVVEISGQKVKLGVEAPEGINVWREELYQDILKNGIRSKKG